MLHLIGRTRPAWPVMALASAALLAACGGGGSPTGGPSEMATAAKVDRPKDRPDDGRYHAADMTGVFNLVAPCPALSVPCGWDGHALPIGLQVVGRRWREDTVLQIGRAVELAIPGAIRRPPI